MWCDKNELGNCWAPVFTYSIDASFVVCTLLLIYHIPLPLSTSEIANSKGKYVKTIFVFIKLGWGSLLRNFHCMFKSLGQDWLKILFSL